MRIVSLGNNCFWGLLVKSTHMLNNTVDFYTKTCFLSHGLFTSNNCNITKVQLLLHFIKLCDADDFNWLNYNNISYRSNPNSNNRDWINYYWYNDKSMPYFFRHIDNVYIDNPNFFNIIKYFMQYKTCIADKYVLSVFDSDINDTIISDLENIALTLKKWNKNAELIVFSETKLKSSIFKNINILLGNCRWKENEDYTVDLETYTSIVNALETNVIEKYFLDINKKPIKYTINNNDN